VKLHVNDGTDDAVFVLFDNDMRHLLDVQCSVLVAAAKVLFCLFYVYFFVRVGCIVFDNSLMPWSLV